MISVPAIDFGQLLVYVFTYVNQFLPTFAPIAALGIALPLVFGLIGWLGASLKGVFGGNHRR